MGKERVGYERIHRFIVYQGVMYRVTETNLKRLLEDVKKSNASPAIVDVTAYRGIPVGKPPRDISDLTPQSAENLLREMEQSSPHAVAADNGR